MYIRLLFYNRIVYNFGMSYLHVCVYCFTLYLLYWCTCWKQSLSSVRSTLLQKVLTYYFINWRAYCLSWWVQNTHYLGVTLHWSLLATLVSVQIIVGQSCGQIMSCSWDALSRIQACLQRDGTAALCARAPRLYRPSKPTHFCQPWVVQN